MFLRWASVSRALVAVTVAGSLSTLELQPLNARTAAAAAIAARAHTVRSLLFAMLVCGEILPVPPAAAQSLKQSRGVGVAAGLGLHEGDARLLVGLFGAQQ